MLQQVQNFYLQQEEPNRSLFLALHDLILEFDKEMSLQWKYSTPFYYYKNQPFCYFWKDRRTNEPYIGVVKGKLIEHPMLEQGNRKKMKIIRLNPCVDIPVESIYAILNELVSHY